jgi:hypothetical protein
MPVLKSGFPSGSRTPEALPGAGRVGRDPSHPTILRRTQVDPSMSDFIATPKALDITAQGRAAYSGNTSGSVRDLSEPILTAYEVTQELVEIRHRHRSFSFGGPPGDRRSPRGRSDGSGLGERPGPCPCEPSPPSLSSHPEEDATTCADPKIGAAVRTPRGRIVDG